MLRFFASVRAFFRKGDMILLALCCFTTLLGVLEIASATTAQDGGNTRFVIVQLAALMIGIVLYYFFSMIDISILANQRLILTIFSTVAIGLLFFFGAEGTTGNKSWLHFSFLPFNIQPAEICKIPFILVIAKTMSRNRDHISSWRNIGELAFHALYLVALILVFSSDAGVALPYVFITLVVAFVGGVRGWWFVGGFALLGAGIPILWNYVMHNYQKVRFQILWDSSIDPYALEERYQLSRSLDTLSGGGLTGQGLFHGAQVQAGRLPAQHTDFIFSSIGEEMGLLGCLVVLGLLVAIIIRCFYVGSKSRSYMNRLICCGIGSMLIFQVLINVGMCIGVVPVIGLTLPFVSYGGSSIVAMYAAMGIVSGIHLRPGEDTTIHYISKYGTK